LDHGYFLLELDRYIRMLIYIARYGGVADVSYRQNSDCMYRQYSFVKAATRRHFPMILKLSQKLGLGGIYKQVFKARI